MQRSISTNCVQSALQKHPDQVKIELTKNRTVIWFHDGYILMNPDKRKYLAVFKSPPIKNIVLSGGGARGVMYPGVIQAFEEYHPDNEQSLIDQVETFAGTSIGSVIAAHAAAGAFGEDLVTLATTIIFKNLLGDGWTPTTFLPPILRDSKPLYQLLRKNIPAAIIKRLSTIMHDESILHMTATLIENSKNFDEAIQQNILKVCHELNKAIYYEKPIITFSMLHALHTLYPKHFKELYVTIVCQETGEVCYASYNESPELEIALACRASAAVPLFTQPVLMKKKFITKYSKRENLPNILNMVDGGYIDNIPFSAVESKQIKERGHNVGDFNQNLQTLIILPDDTKAANYFDANKKYSQSPIVSHRRFAKDELTPSSFLEDYLINAIPKWLGIKTKTHYTAKREHDLIKIQREFSQRTLPINLDVKSYDFDKAQETAADIIKTTRELTTSYLALHHDEYFYQTYDSSFSLINNLSNAKYALLKKNAHNIPLLNDINFNITNTVRMSNKDKMTSTPQFERFYLEFNILINQQNLSNNIISDLTKHFKFILIDDHSDAIKMLRALSIIMFHYQAILDFDRANDLLLLLNLHFHTYFPSRKKQYFMQENNKVEYFNQTHPFFRIYEQIVWLIKETKSNRPNPEDIIHKRRYKETILNDIHDLASFNLTEKDKLKKLELYLFDIYSKMLLQNNNAKSNIALVIKHILQSRELIDLPFHYGVIIPDQFSKIPELSTDLQTSEEKTKLEVFRDQLHDNFILNFMNAVEFSNRSNDITGFSKLATTYIFQSSLSQEKKEIFMRVVVKTLLFSPFPQDAWIAVRLNSQIIPAFVAFDKSNHRCLWMLMTLLTKLSWICPRQHEKITYAQFISELYILIKDYQYHEFSIHQAIKLLKDYAHDLDDTIKQQYFITFFQTKSDLRTLIEKTLIEEEQCMTTNLNEYPNNQSTRSLNNLANPYE